MKVTPDLLVIFPPFSTSSPAFSSVEMKTKREKERSKKECGNGTLSSNTLFSWGS
jgi:hypothetical protein